MEAYWAVLASRQSGGLVTRRPTSCAPLMPAADLKHQATTQHHGSVAVTPWRSRRKVHVARLMSSL